MKTAENYRKHKQAINSLWMASLITFEEQREIEWRLEKAYKDVDIRKY